MRDPKSAAIIAFQGKYLSSTAKVKRLLEYEDLADRVDALSPQNLLLLMEDIGLSDAMFLYEMANPEQMQGILDLTLWDGEQLLQDSLVSWFRYAQAVSEECLQRLLQGIDGEVLLAFILANSTMINQPDKEEDIELDGEFVYTPDRMFLFVVPEESEAARAQASTLGELIRALYDVDMEWARGLLFSALSELPSNLVSRARQFRSSRVADMGFFPFEDAIGMYHVSPIDSLTAMIAEEVEESLQPIGDPGDTFFDTLVPRTAHSRLNDAVETLDDRGRQVFLNNLTYLTNRSLAARRKRLDEIEVVGPELRWVMGHLNLGLEVIAAKGAPSPGQVVGKTTMMRLFQVAVARLSGLRQRALRLLRELHVDAGYTLFDEETTHALSAMATPFTARFHAKGERPFSSLAEVEEGEALLTECEAVVDFFATRLGFDWARLEQATLLPDDDKRYLTFTQLVATLIVHFGTSGELRVAPVSASYVRTFVASSVVEGSLSHGLRQRIAHELLPALLGGTERAGQEWLPRLFEKGCQYLEMHLGQLDVSSPIDPSVLPIGFLSAEE